MKNQPEYLKIKTPNDEVFHLIKTINSPDGWRKFLAKNLKEDIKSVRQIWHPKHRSELFQAWNVVITDEFYDWNIHNKHIIKKWNKSLYEIIKEPHKIPIICYKFNAEDKVKFDELKKIFFLFEEQNIIKKLRKYYEE